MNQAVTSSETYGKSTSRETQDPQLRPDVQLTKVKNENHQRPLPSVTSLEESHPLPGLVSDGFCSHCCSRTLCSLGSVPVWQRHPTFNPTSTASTALAAQPDTLRLVLVGTNHEMHSVCASSFVSLWWDLCGGSLCFLGKMLSTVPPEVWETLPSLSHPLGKPALSQ